MNYTKPYVHVLFDDNCNFFVIARWILFLILVQSLRYIMSLHLTMTQILANRVSFFSLSIEILILYAVSRERRPIPRYRSLSICSFITKMHLWSASGRTRFLPAQFCGYLLGVGERGLVIGCAPGLADARHDPENSCPSRSEGAFAEDGSSLFTKTRVVKYHDKWRGLRLRSITGLV